MSVCSVSPCPVVLYSCFPRSAFRDFASVFATVSVPNILPPLGRFGAAFIRILKVVCVAFIGPLTLSPAFLNSLPFTASHAPGLMGQISGSTVTAPPVSPIPLVLVVNLFGGNTSCSFALVVTLLCQILLRHYMSHTPGVSLEPKHGPLSPGECDGSFLFLATVGPPSFVVAPLV